MVRPDTFSAVRLGLLFVTASSVSSPCPRDLFLPMIASLSGHDSKVLTPFAAGETIPTEDCWYGWNCRTQTHKTLHATRLNVSRSVAESCRRLCSWADD